jgi:hypothetical protein
MGVGSDAAQVGLSRGNILAGSGSPGFTARLLEARIRQELRPAATRKTSHSEVEKDMTLFRQILALQAAQVAASPSVTTGASEAALQ